MKKLISIFAAGLIIFAFSSMGFTEEQKEGAPPPKGATEVENIPPVEKSTKAKAKKSTRAKSQSSTTTTTPAPEVPVQQK